MIGLPLLFWKHAKKNYPDHNGGSSGSCSEKVTFMMLSCDLSDSRFGLAPLKWTGGRIPNVLVTRLDRQPLEVTTFKAFADFCRYRMQPFFAWSCEIGGYDVAKHTDAKNVVMEEMNPAKWNHYWSEWRARHEDDLGGSGDISGIVEGFESLNVASGEKEALHNRLWDEESLPRSPADVRRT